MAADFFVEIGCVLLQDRECNEFKLRDTTMLWRLFTKYCEALRPAPNTPFHLSERTTMSSTFGPPVQHLGGQFTFQGIVISGDDTPAKLGLEDVRRPD